MHSKRALTVAPKSWQRMPFLTSSMLQMLGASEAVSLLVDVCLLAKAHQAVLHRHEVLAHQVVQRKRVLRVQDVSGLVWVLHSTQAVSQLLDTCSLTGDAIIPACWSPGLGPASRRVLAGHVPVLLGGQQWHAHAIVLQSGEMEAMLRTRASSTALRAPATPPHWRALIRLACRAAQAARRAAGWRCPEDDVLLIDANVHDVDVRAKHRLDHAQSRVLAYRECTVHACTSLAPSSAE